MPYDIINPDVYSVKYLNESRFRLFILDLDYQLIVSNTSEEFFVVDKYSLQEVIDNDQLPYLDWRRRYYIRYNNNDRGPGKLNIEIRLIAGAEEIIVFGHRNLSISGPQVIEFPLLFHPIDEYNPT